MLVPSHTNIHTAKRWLIKTRRDGYEIATRTRGLSVFVDWDTPIQREEMKILDPNGMTMDGSTIAL